MLSVCERLIIRVRCGSGYVNVDNCRGNGSISYRFSIPPELDLFKSQKFKNILSLLSSTQINPRKSECAHIFA